MVALLPAAAFGLPITSGEYTITSGGLNSGVICNNAFQCSSNPDFTYAPPAPHPDNFNAATGTITIDAQNAKLSLDITISGASFTGLRCALDGDKAPPLVPEAKPASGRAAAAVLAGLAKAPPRG